MSFARITNGAPYAAALRAAIKAGEKNVAAGGGPFGAAIVKTADPADVVVVTGNSVTRTCDPTAHAEVNAIREACKKLNTHVLTGHVLVTSCYPCPMCQGAAMWSRVDAVVYAAGPAEAASVGFDDAYFYEQIALPDDKKEIRHIRAPDAPEESEAATAAAAGNSPAPSPAASTAAASKEGYALTKAERMAPFTAWSNKVDKIHY